MHQGALMQSIMHVFVLEVLCDSPPHYVATTTHRSMNMDLHMGIMLQTWIQNLYNQINLWCSWKNWKAKVPNPRPFYSFENEVLKFWVNHIYSYFRLGRPSLTSMRWWYKVILWKVNSLCLFLYVIVSLIFSFVVDFWFDIITMHISAIWKP